MVGTPPLYYFLGHEKKTSSWLGSRDEQVKRPQIPNPSEGNSTLFRKPHKRGHVTLLASLSIIPERWGKHVYIYICSHEHRVKQPRQFS